MPFPGSAWTRSMFFRVRDGARVDSPYVDRASRLSAGCVVRPGAIVARSVLGEGVYVNHGAFVRATDVGPYCSLGPRCQIGPNEHLLTEPSTSEYLYGAEASQEMAELNRTRTTLEADVWVGSAGVVLKGRVVGVGSVVAAGAVVMADVEPYTIVAGIPARPLRRRFDDESLCDALVRSEWWLRPSAEIRRAMASRVADSTPEERAWTFLDALEG